jgi:hypothetical protein
MGSGISNQPDLFEFYYGHFDGSSCHAKWNGNCLVVERSRGGNLPTASREVTPSEDSWNTFWNRVGEIGCPEWEPEYFSAHGCCGTTYWSVRIAKGELSISSRGANAFPGGGSLGPSMEFQRFLAAYRVLLEG